MLPQSVAVTSRQIINCKTKSRLLIISDESKYAKILQSELDLPEVEMTHACSTEEVREACCDGHDLAVIDIAPGKLIGVLEILRESAAHRDISILVDNSRLPMDPALAGVMPFYRAMPCNFADLIRLARRRVIEPNALPDARPHYINRML